MMNALSTRLVAVMHKAERVVVLVLMLALGSVAHASVAQSPLIVGGGNVPGNLVLTPSVEYPTVISVANLGNYSLNGSYAGYFDSDKCYDFIQEDNISYAWLTGTAKSSDGAGYFTPVNFDFKTSKNCNGKWSGHYLNWAATQTIDPFRKALTGGYRVVDTPSKTILEKATRAGRTDLFPNRTLSRNLTPLVTPYTLASSYSLTSSLVSGNDFQKNKAINFTGRRSGEKRDFSVFYAVRVEVCKPNLLEENCKKYGSYYKPEGLLQEYADSIRYSVFSYLNINGNNVNGGVLRSLQDYIAEEKRIPGQPELQNNPYKEWNPDTGVLISNPRNDSIKNSGVINYINKFGEISNQHKSNDPVSELYYAAIRYLRGKGNYNAYTNQADSNLKKDYFPVITSWTDPIQYSCQRNAILGIGDVNTHEDRDLLPSDDRSFMNLNDFTTKIFELEGIASAASGVFTGRGNSAYIAGLAYYANTQDMRPDLAGKQTVSTYWLDVRENQKLEGRQRNQYWLAAKYGGFNVPNNYQHGQRLEDAWWYTNGDILESNDKRPDNFYVASDAESMVDGLRQAFAQIANEVQSTTTALAANSSRLETGTAVFQSRLNSKFWSGDLLAKQVNAGGVVAAEPSWSASSKLDALSTAQLGNRNILSIKSGGSTGSNGETVLNNGVDFKWAQLSDTQKAQLKSTEDILNYLRGDRTKELTANSPLGVFRERGGRLGDIINSDPQFVHKQDFGYARLMSWDNDVADKYRAFRSTAAYKARVPLVIVGANDGMLHGFNASLDASAGGTELFAFVPNGVFANLSRLSDLDYAHRYYVDGTPRISDVWLGTSWATVAVGTSGAGGKSVFALNITNLSDSSSIDKNNVMWEFSHPKMGYGIGQPSIVALPNQKFGVIVSSGYHDEAPEKGYVWILDVNDGSIIKEFELDTQGNLGGVLSSDMNSDRQVDRLYVADTHGKVWRIDVDSTTSFSWGIPSTLSGGPLFKVKDIAGNPQAITAPLASAFNERGEHILLFGTGSFYRTGDNEVPDNPPVETLYGLIDKGQLIDGRDSLLKQNIIAEAHLYGKHLRAVTENKLTNEKGWYLDLAWLEGEGHTGAKGERVLAQATLRSNRVLFTTMTPVEDPCASGGTSMTMALDLSSGKRLPYAYFDVDGDGKLGDGDYVDAPDGDDPGIPWSGVSDLSDGVIKGVNAMYKWICYAGSSGAVKCMPVPGSVREGRQSWREVRDGDE